MATNLRLTFTNRCFHSSVSGFSICSLEMDPNPNFIKNPYIAYPSPLSNFVLHPCPLFCLVSLADLVIAPHPLC